MCKHPPLSLRSPPVQSQAPPTFRYCEGIRRSTPAPLKGPSAANDRPYSGWKGLALLVRPRLASLGSSSFALQGPEPFTLHPARFARYAHRHAALALGLRRYPRPHSIAPQPLSATLRVLLRCRRSQYLLPSFE